jgi:hypothetical protein
MFTMSRPEGEVWQATVSAPGAWDGPLQSELELQLTLSLLNVLLNSDPMEVQLSSAVNAAEPVSGALTSSLRAAGRSAHSSVLPDRQRCL